MYSVKRLMLLCGCGWGLLAQSVNDLNSLALQAHRYAIREQDAARCAPVPELGLYRIVGTSGGAEDALMQNGVDLQQWALEFQVERPFVPPPGRQDCSGPGRPDDGQQSVTIRCGHGLFTDLAWSPLPVFDCKSMEWAWFTISLEEAVSRLRRQGFTRGFTRLTLMRPLYYRYPDECTYVFKCPLDHAYVGISAETGRMLWTEAF